MRTRFLLCGTCAVLLAACGGPVEVLPSEEVLRRAAEATQRLESAQYVLEGNFDARAPDWTATGTVRMDGILSGAGEQLSFRTDVTADVRSAEGSYVATGNLEVVLLSRDEVYMNVHSLGSQPANALFRPEVLSKLTGKWWLLPPGDTPPGATQITPDPRLLHIQSQVVTVTRERGIEDMDGHSVYHYDVILDTKKLVAYLSTLAAERGETFDAPKMTEELRDLKASGELWIDAETFTMRKIAWNVQQVPLDTGGTASAAVTIVFRNHDAAPAVVPPEGAVPFTPSIFFTLPSDALFPEELPLPSSDFDDARIDELLRTLNSP